MTEPDQNVPTPKEYRKRRGRIIRLYLCLWCLFLLVDLIEIVWQKDPFWPKLGISAIEGLVIIAVSWFLLKKESPDPEIGSPSETDAK